MADLLPERAPGPMQQVIDRLPVGFADSDLLGMIVTERHGLGAILCMFLKSIGRHLINLAGEIGQCIGQISRWMRCTLTVNDPPLQLETRRLVDIKWGVADSMNCS